MMSTNNNNNPAAAAHINPFYIDPGELELEWEGDSEFEDEYEAEGLLNPHPSSSSSSRQSSAASKKNSATASFGNKKRQQPQLPHVKGLRGLSRGQKRWICILFFFVLVIFFILSSTDSKKSNINNNSDDYNHNNNNDAGETDYVQKDKSNDENINAAATNHDDVTTSTSVDDSSAASTSASSRSKKSRPSSPGGGTSNDNVETTEALSNVHRVVLLGERQTGVDAFKTHWSSCFPTRNFTTTLTRKTTWFQDLSQPPVSSVAASQEKILFVLLVRNPYTWVEAMRGHPLHMSAHVNQTTGKALPWKDFVTQSWSPRYADTTKDETTTTCQHGFAPNQVMPCLPDSTDAHPPPDDVYELRPARGPEHSLRFDMGDPNEISISDLAYANILDLRANKLKHFVYDLPRAYQGFGLMATPLQNSTATTTTMINNNVLIIHYEDDLVVSMQKLEQVTGWSPVEHCRQAKRFPPSITLENLDPEYVQFLSSQVYPIFVGLDWELEAQLGYQKVV